MSRKVFYYSWSPIEATFETERISKLPTKQQWVNAYSGIPTPNDIYLTTNGYDFNKTMGKPVYKRATLYAESYQYLKGEYDNYSLDKKWGHRYHFNPNYVKQPNTTLQKIGCWWESELGLYQDTVKNKDPQHMFGMVLSKKPPKQQPYEFGWYRSEIVNKAKDRSFKYYGGGWDRMDKNYGGEAYVNGNRNTPIKFNDARILMTKSKFVFCVENIHDPVYAVNYLTEKIFHGFLSASVPVYAGCWNVEELIPSDLFIDLRKFNLDITAAMDFCEKITDIEYNGYLSRIGEWLSGEGKKFSCDNRFLELDDKLSKL